MINLKDIKRIYADNNNIKDNTYRFTNGTSSFRQKLTFLSLQDLLNKHDVNKDTLNEIFVKSSNNSLKIIFDLTNGNLIEHRVVFKKK
ncbi:hypothetical protein CWE04_11515 [Thomasclavelia cocleata]|uniref:Uncharacterized protein n=1 Tax=Thomasclavelia cocleata TaxID=69824 RepID=A0A1I0GCQ9_9FIRM|nr:hypothetical protein [Thomasclavelia cocleata]MCR1959846.1 hypothetical protein [Thomasclavelia cocleata]NDO43196.1 hypothetical protein [Thomasclavelia cocleata]PJN79831.1 hypothetical protein CWE04_11515 [Thomasclavelia cocleata]SET68564.1 hypothetical protein SAMN04489758_12821 [Thomasclavelia cocleata]